MEFKCFSVEIVNLCDRQKHNDVISAIPEGYRLPTRSELYGMIDAGLGGELSEHVKDMYFYVTDGKDAVYSTCLNNVNGEISPVFNRVNNILASTCECAVIIQYNALADFIQRNVEICKYCRNTIASMLKARGTDSLDIMYYSDCGIEINDTFLQMDDYDDNCIVGLYVGRNPIGDVEIFVDTYNGQSRNFSTFKTSEQIDILHSVEDILKEVDEGEFPLMDYTNRIEDAEDAEFEILDKLEYTYLVEGIEYDTDNEDNVNLPDKLEIICTSEDEIADKISDITDFLVKSIGSITRIR